MEPQLYKLPGDRKRNYSPVGTTYVEPSCTVDDTCLTPAEILEKYTTGEPIPIIPYDKEFGTKSDNYEDLINDVKEEDYEKDS